MVRVTAPPPGTVALIETVALMRLARFNRARPLRESLPRTARVLPAATENLSVPSFTGFLRFFLDAPDFVVPGPVVLTASEHEPLLPAGQAARAFDSVKAPCFPTVTVPALRGAESETRRRVLPSFP